MPARVLVACEFSGAVRDRMIARGIDAWSCDLLPGEGIHREQHLQCDVLTVLDDGWQMLIAFPPCTYLCSSGLHWNTRRPGRSEETEKALTFVRALLGAPIKRKALENPIGCISTRIRKPDQIIRPSQFGHPESKTTCLWLEQLPPLQPTSIVGPDYYVESRSGRKLPRWRNQTPSGQNRLGPSDDRWKVRSLTYPGVAQAMADQWGPFLTSTGDSNAAEN